MRKRNPKILGSFTLTMIAVAAIIDLRGMPMMASYGFSVIFMYGLATLLFLIPISFVCAELSTRIQQPGGMYVWIKSAFGDKWGFFSMWLEWLNNIIGFPASLSFMSVTLAYIFMPSITQHKEIVLAMTLTILWLITLFTLFGIKASSRLNIIGALFGAIIPAIIIIGLGLAWSLSGKPIQVQADLAHLIPNINAWNPGFFAAIILGFGGMQIVAFHSVNVANPKRTFPVAVFSAAAIVVCVAVLTALAIAVVVPHDKLNLVSGLIDGFNRFFLAFNMPWAISILLALIILSLIATFNAWFLGPARGLAVVAQDGFLPKIFAYVNAHDVPAVILLLQAVIASIMSTVFLYMPDINSAFWVLMNLSSQSALMVYIFIFAAGIKLYIKPGFVIPFGRLGAYIISGIGILTCALALIFSFIPPSIIHTSGVLRYEMVLIIGNIIFLGIPFLIILVSRRQLRLQETF